MQEVVEQPTFYHFLWTAAIHRRFDFSQRGIWERASQPAGASVILGARKTKAVMNPRTPKLAKVELKADPNGGVASRLADSAQLVPIARICLVVELTI